MELSHRIATWRKVRGLTQTDLAKAAGVTTSAVSLYESGKARPSVAVLDSIVERLGLTMAKFYGRVPRAEA
jgi:transcriptional regulator with XRE-family HTH domain